MKYLEKISFKRIPIWIVVLIVIFNLIITVQFGYLVTKSRTALEIAQIPNTLSKIFKGNLNEFGKDVKRFEKEQGILKNIQDKLKNSNDKKKGRNFFRIY